MMKISSIRDDEILTAQEAARILKVSDRFIRLEIERRELPAMRFGKIYRIKQEDFNEYMMKNKTV